jgi:hypothetical protein
MKIDIYDADEDSRYQAYVYRIGPRPDILKIRAWMDQHIGRNNYVLESMGIGFANVSDATLFMLRWA